ncbi:MAG: Heme/hemopexin utilization protein precursor [Pseudomonadota bacterium]
MPAPLWRWVACAGVWFSTPVWADDPLPDLQAEPGLRPGNQTLLRRAQSLAPRAAAATDTAELLRGQPGVSLYSAGGLSALPVLRGLADDRIRVRVNGVDLQPACPNHMNAPLSYIAPAQVSSVKVQAGVTPVSAGGDSLGGAIDVQTTPPRFAEPGASAVVAGELGAFWRSNGQVRGAHAQADWGGEAWSLSYKNSMAKAANYHAARAFKLATRGSEFGRVLAGDEVGSSAYGFVNQDLGVAWRHEGHLLRADVGQQRVSFEGFPNQRMDMTDNRNDVYSLRYTGELDWGRVEGRLSSQRTHHAMDMGPDRYQYGYGMPMLTRADTDSGLLHASWQATDDDQIKLGAEYLRHTLWDWWPPVGTGAMAPNAFWNVDQGRRHRLAAFAEWERRWAPAWTSVVGLRRERVAADAAPVQGYDNGLPMWGDDAAAFNARDHRHVDHNWDLSAEARHRPDAHTQWALGYARQTHSPNLYQRYPWSTQAMAALMNNFVGDGNGYVGREDLRPEVAHTVNVSGQWASLNPGAWGAKVNAYVTHIVDHIDAQRCNVGQCSAANQTAQGQFVLLRYVNQSARIVGMDVAGEARLAQTEGWGRFDVQGVLNLLRGTNLATQEPLYNMMPANATLALVQRLGPWRHSAEWVLVAGKHRVSAVRNEMATAGHGLLNWRSSREWARARLDVGVDNVFNQFYRQPLGGAYVGQGASMSSQGIAWGQVVPGPGRSVSVALTWRL